MALVAIGEDTVCEVEANKNLPIYIRAKTDADSVAGDYSAKITVTDESGSEALFTTEVKAKVWNFTLPETPTCITSFGNGCHGGFREKFSVSDEEFKEIEKKLNESLLEHKLSPYFLLNEIATGEADEEMSDPRLTSFEIRYTDDDDLLLARWNRIISNPEWEKKAHFYVVDEPQTMEHVERIIKTSVRLKRLCPGYKYVLPSNLPYSVRILKSILLMIYTKDRVNILCPLSLFFADPDYLSKITQI